jgi:peptidoglycan/LPS O-acetylase OafA/YrhL
MPDLPPRPPSESYMRQLDGLRALAVAGVIVEHYFPHTWMIHRIPTGFAGVRLFFVLSGFLITGILLRSRLHYEQGQCTRRLALRQFYVRRFLRIFPLYYASILVLYLLNVAQARDEIFWHLSYLSNILYGRLGNFSPATGHFWSLAVEEQFYLLWPALILLTPRRHLLKVVVGFTAAAPVAHVVGFMAGLNPVALQGYPLMCFDALGLGALLSYASEPGFGGPVLRRRLLAWGAWVAPIVIVGVACNTLVELLGWRVSGWGPVWELALPPLFALACVWIIGRAARGWGGPIGALLDIGPLVYLGKISYGIYILHNFVFFAVPLVMQKTGYPLTYVLQKTLRFTPDLERGSWFFVVFWTSVTIALAALSWHLFEKPINDLKRYFPYRPRMAPPSTTAVPRATAGPE